MRTIFRISILVGAIGALLSLCNEPVDRPPLQEGWTQKSTFEMTTEQSDRQAKDKVSGFKSTEPAAKDVTLEEEEMYNWIIDHPNYDGDYEFWEEKYQSGQGGGI